MWYGIEGFVLNERVLGVREANISQRRSEMTDELTCCEPRIDTFLAVTRVKPVEFGGSEKTEAEKRGIEERLVNCIYHPKEIGLEL